MSGETGSKATDRVDVWLSVAPDGAESFLVAQAETAEAYRAQAIEHHKQTGRTVRLVTYLRSAVREEISE